MPLDRVDSNLVFFKLGLDKGHYITDYYCFYLVVARDAFNVTIEKNQDDQERSQKLMKTANYFYNEARLAQVYSLLRDPSVMAAAVKKYNLKTTSISAIASVKLAQDNRDSSYNELSNIKLKDTKEGENDFKERMKNLIGNIDLIYSEAEKNNLKEIVEENKKQALKDI